MGDFTQDDSRQRLLTQHRVPWLKQCSHAKQCLPDIVTPCWSKNCRYESSLRHRRNLTLVKFICKQCQSSCSGSLLCTRIWVHAMIGLLKKPLSICQSGWKEIQNAPPVIFLLVAQNIACENICFSSLFAAGDFSRRKMSVTQRQKFPPDDANIFINIYIINLAVMGF